MIEAVIFDLFHTLVDPEDFRPKDFKRVILAAEACGLDSRGFAEFWQQTATERNTTPTSTEVWIRRYAQAVGIPVAPSSLVVADEILGRYQETAILRPRPEAEQALQRLHQRGLTLGLLSNAFAREVRAWDRSPLAPYFSAACFSSDLGLAKPDVRAYAAVLGRLGIPARRAAFVGDGLSDELIGARDAGLGRVIMMQGFVARNGLRTAEEVERLHAQADGWVDTLDEVPRMLARVDAGDGGA